MSLALLPERRHLCGPVTRRRIARSGIAYGALLALGLAIAGLVDNAQWRAFGLGMMAPGAGFLPYADLATWHGMGHFAVAALSAALFLAAVLVWFANGNALAPPSILLLTAAAAAAMHHGEPRPDAIWIVSLIVSSIPAAAILTAMAKHRYGLARRRAANEYLAGSGLRIAGAFQRADEPPAEFTPRELELMRFLLDRALQPVSSYDGFEWRDQYQTAAVRYQLQFMGYALSMAQATRLPALGGYLDEAQRRLIEKQTDHRIWRYWAQENLWGNLARDPDPVARENIMFGGFCAAQIAMYHAASGRRDFDRRGSFALRHPSGQTFSYDLPSLIEALDRQYAHSVFYLIPCEPNWVYPLCNTIAAAAVKARDVQTGGKRWKSHAPAFREHLEAEFIDLSGRFVPCRSTYTGFALPTIGGAQPQAMPSFFLNATLPDLALRQWLLLRRTLVGATGAARLRRSAFWPIDTGNYGYSRAAAFAGTALAAAEMGDREATVLCLSALDEECPAVIERRVLHRPRASVWAHAVEFLARSGSKNAFRDLIQRPRNTAPRPAITDIRYPDVLAARAVHRYGGLAAVLYPGRASGRHQIGLSGLSPGSTYACDGTVERRIVADTQGRTAVTVDIDGRKEIQVRPAA